MLPNNTVLLVSIQHFDPDPIVVNVNKLKPYPVLDSDALESLPGPTVSKTAIKAMTIDNEDEPTRKERTPLVGVDRVDWSNQGQTPPPFLLPPPMSVTSRLKWH